MDQEEVSKEHINVIQSSEPGFEVSKAFMSDQTDMNDHRDLSLDYYFKSYSHLGIHESMLKDKHRTMCYMDAMLRNKHLFKGKVVLDIGCGTGILSMFAAKAGAKHVFAVDFATITHQAQEIVIENGLQDQITVIRGKIEEIELPVANVDIIISEWMGYFLLYESMLDSVLFARDKWLTPEGLIFPDRAIMYIAGIEDSRYFHNKLRFWEQVYGLDMSPMKPLVQKEAMISSYTPDFIVTRNCPILDINLKTVKVEDLDFVSDFSLKATHSDQCSAFVVWFDTFFTPCNVPIILTTSPYELKTHWKQTAFYLESPIPIKSGDFVTGTIAVRKNKKNPRSIDVLIVSRVTDQAWQSKAGRSESAKIYFIS